MPKGVWFSDMPAGFTAARYETRRRHNWHYDCAQDLIAGRLADVHRGGYWVTQRRRGDALTPMPRSAWLWVLGTEFATTSSWRHDGGAFPT
jgi:hypothetical protein